MKNLQFNKDGPVPVSEEDFLAYQHLPFEHQAPYFDFFFYTWINENYPDGVRRLCLREMLRHPSGGAGPHSYYSFCDNFTRILHIGSQNKSEKLYWHLHNRPKLLAEFVQEYKYLLDSPIAILPAEGAAGTEAEYDILEILFQFVDEPTGRELFKHYYIWGSGRNSYDNAERILRVWSDERYPEWLRTELFIILKKAVQKEIWALHIRPDTCSENSLTKIVSGRPGAQCLMLTATLKFIRQYAYKPEKKDLTPVVKLFDVIQSTLPPLFCIIPYNTLIPILYQLKDFEALRIARCHLLTGYHNRIDSVDKQAAINFLYWMEGVARRVPPSTDQELCDAINNFYPVVYDRCEA